MKVSAKVEEKSRKCEHLERNDIVKNFNFFFRWKSFEDCSCEGGRQAWKFFLSWHLQDFLLVSKSVAHEFSKLCEFGTEAFSNPFFIKQATLLGKKNFHGH